MESVHEDCFVVFVRDRSAGAAAPQDVESEVVSCPTYEEACRVRQRFQRARRECVIRYMGQAGGGD